jgi:zinc protease
MATSTRLAGLAAILLAGGCCPTRALPVMQEVTAVSLPVERYRLDNGLEVILHEDHRSPVVSVNLWYHVGAKDEPPHRNGFAHLFEHLMFQGPATWSRAGT